ncbi:hypothetical protein C823_007827 [Eubacterium plexicaudatum ASF492]|uniref:Uncharacterized protein n=1 Tax=Eubacterium plexicaudatum ASF492 TaxID=1235802 RepID=N2A502_9FIRM|nr:hypothetical protein C823_007827 [Eubacterium plexicaudatum ASF492]
MICKTCNKVMSITGTRYEQKKNKDGSKQFLHKPYCECGNCKYRKYTKFTNFQEIIKRFTNT